MIMSIGKRIQSYRKKQGLSQNMLARLSNISNDYMNRIENDKVENIGIEKLESIASALNLKSSIFLLMSKEAIAAVMQDSESKKNAIIQKSKGTISKPFIPIVTLTEINEGIFFDNDGNIPNEWHKEVLIPNDLKVNRSYAIYIDNSAMEPFIKNGHVLYCIINKELTIGNYVVVQLHSKKVLIAEYLSDNDKDLILLNPINPLHPPKLIPIKDVKEIHIVAWIKQLEIPTNQVNE